MKSTAHFKQEFLCYGLKGKEAAFKEMKQLQEKGVFAPVNLASFPNKDKDQMESLIFLVEKSDKRIKAKTCENGSIQHKFINNDEGKVCFNLS